MILSVSGGEVKRGIQKSDGSPSLGKTDTPPRNVLASHEEIKSSMKGGMKGVIRYSLYGFVTKQVRRGVVKSYLCACNIGKCFHWPVKESGHGGRDDDSSKSGRDSLRFVTIG